MEGYSTSFDGRLIFFEIPPNTENDIIGGIAWTKRSPSPKYKNNEIRSKRGTEEEKRTKV